MRAELLEKLVSEYYLSRPNLEVDNAPLCIFFFACSGSGKSTTRKLLVDTLRATYVCNDEVRLLLEKHPEAAQQGIELKDIVAETVKKIFADANNKLVVYDNNIIQYYMHDDSYLNVARTNHLPIFIIGIEASEKELKERIRKRGINVAQILKELPGQICAYNKATKDIVPDWVIKDIGSKEGVEPLISHLSVTEY